MNIIEINNLKKYFKDVKAVDDISFFVREGELFAFLGLNGAGKSTTISIICGQKKKDSGTVFVNGKNIDESIDEIKSDIGVVFQDSILDSVLTVKQNLKLKASLYGIIGESFDKKLEELNQLLDLKELYNRPYGKLSGGQMRRVDFARALLNSPKILILDEPTTGLDPQSRIMVWSVVDKLRHQNGLTVFLTTHYMEEASEADYIIILDSGKIVANGTPHDLKTQLAKDNIKLYNIEKDLLNLKGIAFQEENGYLKIPVDNTQEARDLIIKYPDIFTDFEIVKGNMDDVFLNATGKKIGQGEKYE